MISLLMAVIISTGAIDANCTKDMICQDGYTATVRPKTSYTNHLKREQMIERELPGSTTDYEEDHFIPLELCGCPDCPENLWPEPWPEAREKDVDETRLHRQVCEGELTLPEAQDFIRAHWKIHE